MGYRKDRTIYTIGHSNRKLADFIKLLKQYSIEFLIDVRRFPTSKKYPWFMKENLKVNLEAIGIKYIWLGKLLGGYRSGGYLKYMETEDFKNGVNTLVKLASKYRIAIMCSEKLWFKCHRKFISDILKNLGFKVIHIIDPKREYEHKHKLKVK